MSGSSKESWRLTAWGRLTDEPSWDLESFSRLPRRTVRCALHCSRRADAGVSDWTGVATRLLIGRISLKPDAAFVMVHGVGDYRAGMPIARFAGADALLALSRNGQALGADEGGPVRLIVPGRSHCDSVKSVRGLEFLVKHWPGTRELEGDRRPG